MNLSNLTSTGVQFIRNHILDRNMKNPEYVNAMCHLATLIDDPDAYNKALMDYSNGAAMTTQRI